MTDTRRDLYRTLTIIGMLTVSIVAAILSFMHIETLAIRNGQPVLAADILPMSIDGTIVVSSMSMLRAARSGLTSPALARVMMLLAIVATLACNVSYGLPYGVTGALLSGWPAIAFIGCAELSIGMVRRRPVRQAVTRLEVVTPGGNGNAVSSVTDDSATVPNGRDSNDRRLAKMLSQDQAALAALTQQPGMSFDELAESLGVSTRTARRVKARLNGNAPHVTV